MENEPKVIEPTEQPATAVTPEASHQTEVSENPAVIEPVATVAPTVVNASATTQPVVADAPQTKQIISSGVNPGKTLGVVGLILAVLLPLIGLILSIIAKHKSKKAGFKNGAAVAGIIISIVVMLLSVVAVSAIVLTAVNVTKAPIAASGAFLDNLTSNNLVVAYNSTGAGFREGYTQKEFNAAFTPAVEAGLKKVAVISSNVATNNGLTSATVVYKATASDGNYKVTVELEKVNNDWKIVNVTSAKQ